MDSKLFTGQTNSSMNLKENNNLYVGIGMCTRDNISYAVPFDILSLILCAEKLRRDINAEKVLYILADTHAVITGHDEKKIVAYTMQLCGIVECIINEWAVPHQVLISSFLHDIDYSGASIKNVKEKYLTAEIEDMYYFIHKHGVGYKLGWKYPDIIRKRHVVGFDEWHFDKQARKLGVPMEYYYIEPGHTMNKQHSLVSPYVCLDTKNRIVFKDVNLDEKLNNLLEANNNTNNMYKKYLVNIQLLYSELFSKPIKGLVPFVLNLHKQFS